MDSSSVEIPTVNNVNLKKRKKRRSRKLSNNEHTIQNMDQNDKNVDDFESGKEGVIDQDCSQDNLLKVDLGTELSQEHPKADTSSTTNVLEKSGKSKRTKRRRAKKKAESKQGAENLDHTDVMSILSLADANDGHADGKTNNTEVVSQESRHSAENASAVSLSRLSADLADKDHELVGLHRINDTTSATTNLSLEDASNGHSDGINSTGGVSQESALSMGKCSAVSLSSPSIDLAQKDCELRELCRSKHTASSPSLIDISSYNVCPQFSQHRVKLDLGISNREVSAQRSSEVMNEAQNCLLADRDRIPPRINSIRPRRKLLILDVNGLLADIVNPAPLDCRADNYISGRASESLKYSAFETFPLFDMHE